MIVLLIPRQQKKSISIKKQVSLAQSRVKGRSLRGRGGYLSDLWREGRKLIPRAIGGAAGVLAGNGKAGWNMGGEFSKKVLGWGDYSVPWTVGMNSLVTNGQAPHIGNVSESGMRLVHREYIGTLYSSTAFANNVFYVNPGLAGTFPWLSKIAANFQQYELMGAVVTFKSALTDAVASFSSLGSVVIAADMNSAAAPATSQLAMEQMQFVASAKPSETVVAPIECAPRLGGAGVRYIRAAAVPAAASILDYDHCMIQVAAVGQPTAGIELGRLYISYDVKLLNPKMITGAGNTAYFTYTPVSTYPFGVAGPTRVFDSIGISTPGDGTGYKTVVIPPGSGTEFELDLFVFAGGDMAPAVPTITITNIAASTRRMPNGSNYMASPVAPVAATRTWMLQGLYKILDPSIEARIVVGPDIPFHSTGVSGGFMITMDPPVNLTTPFVGMNHHYSVDEVPDVDEKSEPELVEPYFPTAAAAAAGAPRPVRRPG